MRASSSRATRRIRRCFGGDAISRPGSGWCRATLTAQANWRAKFLRLRELAAAAARAAPAITIDATTAPTAPPGPTPRRWCLGGLVSGPPWRPHPGRPPGGASVGQASGAPRGGRLWVIERRRRAGHRLPACGPGATVAAELPQQPATNSGERHLRDGPRAAVAATSISRGDGIVLVVVRGGTS
jgi:hypothetical protein